MSYEYMEYHKDYDPMSRIVRQDTFEIEEQSYLISTVDLGINHGHRGQPLFYETMIFPESGGCIDYCKRYETREEARDEHIKLLGDILLGKRKIENGNLE